MAERVVLTVLCLGTVALIHVAAPLDPQLAPSAPSESRLHGFLRGSDVRRRMQGHSDDVKVEVDVQAIVNYVLIGLAVYVALQPVFYAFLTATDRERRDNASTAWQCLAPCAVVLFYERECNPMAVFALFFGPLFTCFCYEQPDQAVLAREGIGQGSLFSCDCKKFKVMAGYAEEDDEDGDSDSSDEFSSSDEDGGSGDEEGEGGEDGDGDSKKKKKKEKKKENGGAPQGHEMSRHRSKAGMAKDLKGGRRGSFLRISSASRNRVGSAKYFADQKKLERKKSRMIMDSEAAAATGVGGGAGGGGGGKADSAKAWAKRRRGSVVTGSVGKWEVHKDPKTGKVFYFDPQTKQSRWDKPKEGASGGPGGGGGSGGGGGGGGAATGGKKGADTPASWAARRRGSIVTGTVGKWEVHKDPNSGATFYYNKFTKASQWTKPAEMQPQEVRPILLAVEEFSSDSFQIFLVAHDLYASHR